MDTKHIKIDKNQEIGKNWKKKKKSPSSVFAYFSLWLSGQFHIFLQFHLTYETYIAGWRNLNV